MNGQDRRKNLRRGAVALALILIAVLAWMMWPRAQRAEPFDYIAEQARKLDFNAERIAAFMRDEVKAERYEGVLRGPLGTLWSGAGNDIDRALLLQALLGRAKINSRLVKGQNYGVEMQRGGGFVPAGPDPAAPAGAQPVAAPDPALFHTIEIALESAEAGGPKRETLATLNVADTIGRDLRLSYRRQDRQAFAVLEAGGRQFSSQVDAAAAGGQFLVLTLRAPGRPDLIRRRELFTAAFADYPNVFDPANRYALVISAGWIPSEVLAKETELAADWPERTDALNHLIAYAFLSQSDRHAQAMMREKAVAAAFIAPRLIIVGAEIENDSGKPRRVASIDLRLNDIATDAPPDKRAAFQSARSRFDAALESTVLTAMTGDQAYSASDALADGFHRQSTALVQRQFLLTISLGRLLYEARPGSALSIAPQDRPELSLRIEWRDKDKLEAVFSDKLSQALAGQKTGDLAILGQRQFAKADIERVARELEVAWALAGKLPIRYALAFDYVEAPAGEWYRGARLFFRDAQNRLVFERQYTALEPDIVVETVDYFDDRTRQFLDPPRRFTVRVPAADSADAKIITTWYFTGAGNAGAPPEMLSHAAYQELKRTGSVALRVRMGDRSDTDVIRFWQFAAEERELPVNQRKIKVKLLTLKGDFEAKRKDKPANPADIGLIVDPASNNAVNAFLVLDDPKFPLFGVSGAQVQTAIPGRVTDRQTGAGVPVARVSIAEARIGAITWPDGGFSLPLIKEPFREFEISVEAPGYKPLRAKIDLRRGENLPLALALEPDRAEGGFTWIDRANRAAALAQSKLSPRSRALIGEALDANPNLRIGVPRFMVFAPYGAIEAWIEFDSVAMTEYPRMADGLYGSTARAPGVAAVALGLGYDAWYYLHDDIAKWATDKVYEKALRLPNASVSYFFGRVASWYLFAAGALDSVSMSIEQGGASLAAMYKNAVKKSREFAQMYEQGYAFDQMLDQVGGNYDSFKKGLKDGQEWAEEFYKKAWGL